MSQLLMVFCTCADNETAEQLSRSLVEQQLAACVNILPKIRSIYCWQGRVEAEDEVLMLIKTTDQRYPALETWLLEQHPYEVPEIVALQADRVAAGYKAWVEAGVLRDMGAGS